MIMVLSNALHQALFELKNEYEIYRSLRLSWKSYHGTHQYKLLPAKKFPKPFELNFARRLVRKILEAFYKVGFEFVTSASIITDKETLIHISKCQRIQWLNLLFGLKIGT